MAARKIDFICRFSDESIIVGRESNSTKLIGLACIIFLPSVPPFQWKASMHTVYQREDELQNRLHN